MQDQKICILVADDDAQIREVLALLLEAEGYRVLTAEDGLQAVQLADSTIDLYILDVNMPNLTGIQAAARLREQFDAPIVFLTAYGGESDKVLGFSVGADDYIVKPFSATELQLRIRAILRRSAAPARQQGNTLAFRDLLLDMDRQCVLREGQTISLTHTEFKLLELLVTNRKKIFSLENIYRSIWDDNAVGDETIMVHIKNLRRKLGDNSREPLYIKTAWGRGYYVD